MNSERNLGNILKNLVPRTHEELSQVRSVLHFAKQFQSGVPAHLAERCGRAEVMELKMTQPANPPTLSRFLSSLSEEERREFHGLVEAIEIHQSISGRSLSIENLTLMDKSLFELKQIRDLCLGDGVVSMF